MDALLAELVRKLDALELKLQRVVSELEALRGVLDAPKVMRDVRHCQRKAAYPTAKDALTVIRALRRGEYRALTEGRKRPRTAERLRYYHCPVCKNYHLTKKTLE